MEATVSRIEEILQRFDQGLVQHAKFAEKYEGEKQDFILGKTSDYRAGRIREVIEEANTVLQACQDEKKEGEEKVVQIREEFRKAQALTERLQKEEAGVKEKSHLVEKKDREADKKMQDAVKLADAIVQLQQSAKEHTSRLERWEEGLKTREGQWQKRQSELLTREGEMKARERMQEGYDEKDKALKIREANLMTAVDDHVSMEKEAQDRAARIKRRQAELEQALIPQERLA